VRTALRALAAVAVTAVLAAGCSRAGTTSTQASSSPPASSSASSSGTGSTSSTASGPAFGTVTDACHGGSATGATDQGVTSGQILAGVLTDVLAPPKIVADIHDTQMLDVVGATAEACQSDFVLAGGSAALDGLAVDTRLKCLLPDFDAQVVMEQANGSSLQIYPITNGYSYSPYGGYYNWLIDKKYPASRDAVGILSGASVITQVDSQILVDTAKAVGGKVVYNGTFPISGVTDWTPYAETLKNKGVKGFTFYGEPEQLAALEQAMDNIGYKPDWIDANTNSYGTDFISLLGKAASEQTNYASLPAVYPIEKAADNPATEQLVKLFAQYAPGQPLTLQDVQAWSAWLIFATSAETCGSALTRLCVYDAALKQTDWTGGGLTAPVNLSDTDAPPTCFDVEQATASGWAPAPFGPNNGAYYCGSIAVRLPAGFPQPATLGSVGKSMADVK
jgi:Periplasmic binding protein